MKISNSKQELARIISENGGWREGADTCSCDHDGYVSFFVGNPTRNGGSWLDNGDCEYIGGTIATKYEKIKNWHQTILSREEYFHLYPTPDADGWIEHIKSAQQVDGFSVVDVRFRDGGTAFGPAHVFDWSVDGGEDDIISCRRHKPEKSKPEFCELVMRSIPEPTVNPTIEQLASDYRNAKDYADRKQQEADDARADAEAKLAELVAAGEALGLVVSVASAEPELVINDWRDLRVGDEVECVDYDTEHRFGVVRSIDKRAASQWVEVLHPNMDVSWPSNWCFIRRP